MSQATQPVGLWIAVDGDMVDGIEFDARLGQAIVDCLRRESRPMLDAPEPFFFRRGDESAVANQAG